MAKTLVLFDFDGTITTKDTLLELIKFHKGKWTFYIGMLKLVSEILGYKLGFINNEKMKVKVLEHFWSGVNEDDFNTICANFFNQKMPTILRDKAIEQLYYHVRNNNTISVVSASGVEWIKPFCDAYGINCIATRLEKIDGKITGKIEGLNCNHIEKVNRIKEVFSLQQFDEIIAYGDSKGDKAMFEIATRAYFKPFR